MAPSYRELPFCSLCEESWISGNGNGFKLVQPFRCEIFMPRDNEGNLILIHALYCESRLRVPPEAL